VAEDAAASCPPDAPTAEPPAAALVVADRSRVVVEGDASRLVLREEPSAFAVGERPAGIDLDALRRAATVRTTGGWLVPTGVPAVVHAGGDLTLGPGRGAGVVLVEGRLTLVAPLVFDGLLVATGGVEARGTGLRLRGSLVTPGDARLDAAGTLAASRCALHEAALLAARPVPVPRWSWSPLR
jgi:hypothetical protein